MAMKLRSGRRRLPYVRTIIIAGIVVVLMVWGPSRRAVTSTLASVSVSIQSSLRMLTHLGSKKWNTYVDVEQLMANYQTVQTENANLKIRVIELEQLSREVDSLRELMNLSKIEVGSSIVADVVAHDPHNDYMSMTINKGTTDGVAVNMTVMVAEGLVGRVMQVRDHMAIVLLMTDPNFAADVIIQRSSVRAVMTGIGHDITLERSAFVSRMEYLKRESDVTEGDVVLTSGLDGIHRAGVPVGVVHAVRTDNSGLFMEADVVPLVNVSLIRHVIVVAR